MKRASVNQLNGDWLSPRNVAGSFPSFFRRAISARTDSGAKGSFRPRRISATWAETLGRIQERKRDIFPLSPQSGQSSRGGGLGGREGEATSTRYRTSPSQVVQLRKGTIDPASPRPVSTTRTPISQAEDFPALTGALPAGCPVPP